MCRHRSGALNAKGWGMSQQSAEGQGDVVDAEEITTMDNVGRECSPDAAIVVGHIAQHFRVVLNSRRNRRYKNIGQLTRCHMQRLSNRLKQKSLQPIRG